MSRPQDRSLSDNRRAADSLFASLIVGLGLLALGVGALNGAATAVLVIGTPVALVAAAAARASTGASGTRRLLGALSMVQTGVLIHAAGGLIEAHFAVFVLLALHLAWSDWTTVAISAAVIAVHHAGGHLLHSAGMPIMVFPHQHPNPWTMLVVHALAVVVEAGVLIWMSVRAEADAKAAEDVRRLATRLANGELSADASETSRADLAGALARATAEIGSALQVSRVDWVQFGRDRQAKLEQDRILAEAAERERREHEENERRVRDLLAVVDAAVEGDLTHDVTVTGDDPIGRVATGVDRLLGDLRQSLAAVRDSSIRLTDSASVLRREAEQLRQSAVQGDARASEVAGSAEEVSAALATVSQSTNELAVAVREISRSAQQSGTVVQNAVEAARRADSVMGRLGTASTEIAQVVELINAVAEQTNLLALNASIEAARAGDAGRGFAVVANEVKGLAGQTAGSTRDISARIDSIRDQTQQAVATLHEVSEIIGSVSALQETIAGAVEEQTAMTAEIARSVHEAASGGQQIASAAAGVADGVAEMRRGADGVGEAASALDQVAAELQELVGRYRLDGAPAAGRATAAVPRSTRSRPQPRTSAGR